MSYEPDNIFAKIVRGEVPCHKVFEDATTIAFMDIMPRASGHTLVIPKAPARNILDVSSASLRDVMATTQRIAVAALRAMKADGLTIQQFSEPAGGQLVFHLHFHVIPRFAGVELLPHSENIQDPFTLAEHASRIRAELGVMPFRAT